MPEDKATLRQLVRDNLDHIMTTLNNALKGKGLNTLEPAIQRVGRGGLLPHWYGELRDKQTIVNLDGKTIGSILEMLLVAVLETGALKPYQLQLRINPARGIDLPDLDLGVKSPSRNFCTSEPFFSAYERLYGNDHDCLVLLTDYQDAKKEKGNFQLQVESWRYLKASEIADRELCRIAKTGRYWLLTHEDEATTKRFFKFLAYANQSDWQCRKLLELANYMALPSTAFDALLKKIEADFNKQNKNARKKDGELLPESDLLALRRIFETTPRQRGLIHQMDNWVTEFLKDASRAPNDNEWGRLLESPLDGKIGMSFALQWRYNFGKLFKLGE